MPKTETDRIATEYEKKHLSNQRKLERTIQRLYEHAIDEVTALAAIQSLPDGTFSLTKLPGLNQLIDKVLKKLAKDVEMVLRNGITDAWSLSNDKNDTIFDARLDKSLIPDLAKAKFYDVNKSALDQFLARKSQGLNLSDRVWNNTKRLKSELEASLGEGIAVGKPAARMAKDAKAFLNYPDKLFRRVRDAKGKLQLSQNAKAFNPGQGVYRSSYKNALRLTGTETNMAYRTADMNRYANNPLVLGFEVKLSNNHPKFDVCDSLQGNYPTTFKFVGWHPHCYSEDTEVLTKRGWKFFKDLLSDDLIFAIDPETRNPEYVGFDVYIKKEHKGEMIRFSNRNLDMLVTPDHPMKYLNKSDGKFKQCEAKDYTNNKGGLYRSSKYNAIDTETIAIGNHVLDFDLYTEFMAYYLAEGSLSWTRINQFSIAQCKVKHKSQYEKIMSLLRKLPFKFSENGGNFYLRDAGMYEYLKKFGKSPDKHVPDEILNASPRQIAIFLDGYAICDGHTKKTKREFIGNRGGRFTPNNFERVFFSSSDKMASNIGEMLVKIGKRPSYKIQPANGVPTEHKNGIYFGNKDVWIISVCHSETTTIFNKTSEEYDGFVYDVQLVKHHIMYVRRNGKCVWGSNCRCFEVPILMNDAQFAKYERLIINGSDTPENIDKILGKSRITKPHAEFDKWISDNTERLGRLKSEPYFIRDNKAFLGKVGGK